MFWVDVTRGFGNMVARSILKADHLTILLVKSILEYYLYLLLRIQCQLKRLNPAVELAFYSSLIAI